MESLKKNGFVVGVVGMVLLLGVFAYFVAWSWGVGTYRSLQRTVGNNQKKLEKYAQMGMKDLPTDKKVEVDAESRKRLQAELDGAMSFLQERARKLVRLQLAKAGEVFEADDDAAFQSAFNTAVEELTKKYNAVRRDYIKRVFPARVADAPEVANSSFKLALAPDFASGEEGLVEAAQMCRIAGAILAAATESKWGGVTHIGIEKRKPVKVADTRAEKAEKHKERKPAAARRTTTRRTTDGAAEEVAKAPEAVAEIDPRSLYERVKVAVAGEIRFEDVGPFLHALDLRANDPEDPVFFVVDEVFLNKQKERLLHPYYQAEEHFSDTEAAEAAALDHEVKLPTATIRLNLSVLKFKGFAQ